MTERVCDRERERERERGRERERKREKKEAGREREEELYLRVSGRDASIVSLKVSMTGVPVG